MIEVIFWKLWAIMLFKFQKQIERFPKSREPGFFSISLLSKRIYRWIKVMIYNFTESNLRGFFDQPVLITF